MRDASMMSGKLLFVVGMWGLALGVLGIPQAQAQSGNAPLAVLGLETSDGAPAAVANTITDALRQKVSSTKGFKLVAGKDLMEVKLIFSCPDEAPSCMAQAAKSLGAEKLIFGSVKKAADGYLVTLKMLDASKGRVDAWVAEQIARTQATAPGVRGPVQKWFATLTGAGTSGSIRVTSDIVGASVLLDGLPVGVTTEEALEMGGIATGRHEIVISKPGYEPVRRDVEVVGGEVANVNATMGAVATSPPRVGGEGVETPGGPSTPEASRGDDRTGLKIGTWVALGAGAVAVALGAKFSMDVQQADKDLDAYRRFECPGGGGVTCDASGEDVGALSEDEQREVKQILDDAETPKTMQWVGYGVGAALLGTGVYLFYKAYVADDDSTSDQAPLSKRLQLSPVVTAHGGGVEARLTF